MIFSEDRCTLFRIMLQTRGVIQAHTGSRAGLAVQECQRPQRVTRHMQGLAGCIALHQRSRKARATWSRRGLVKYDKMLRS